MEITHFVASLPLLILFIVEMIFFRRGLIHLAVITYTIALSWYAVTNQWEIMFFPLCIVIGIISIILFGWCMLQGDWL